MQRGTTKFALEMCPGFGPKNYGHLKLGWKINKGAKRYLINTLGKRSQNKLAKKKLNYDESSEGSDEEVHQQLESKLLDDDVSVAAS